MGVPRGHGALKKRAFDKGALVWPIGGGQNRRRAVPTIESSKTILPTLRGRGLVPDAVQRKRGARSGAPLIRDPGSIAANNRGPGSAAHHFPRLSLRLAGVRAAQRP